MSPSGPEGGSGSGNYSLSLGRYDESMSGPHGGLRDLELARRPCVPNEF
jgi:hypothetical protein